MTPKKQVKALPFPIYFWQISLIAVIGLLDSLYLARAHYRVFVDIGYQSFCAISKAINCDTVSQSPYAVFFHLPLAVWGVIGYLFVIALLFIARHPSADRKRIWSILFVMSLLFCLHSIMLAAISTFYIHSYCMMCILSYGVNFLLLFYVWLIRKRFQAPGLVEGVREDIRYLWDRKTCSIPALLSFAAVVSALVVFYPAYWHLDPPPLTSDIPKGMTDKGHPWIGAENPVLEVVEYADYQCFQCKKMHLFLRRLVARHPDKVRLIHRHYPMDHKVNPVVKEPFHEGSGVMAIMAIYAAEKNRFWIMNDILFDLTRTKFQIDTKELAKKAGLSPGGLTKSLFDKDIRNKLWLDIKDGMKLGVTGTPAYVINKKLYLSNIPSDVLEGVLE